MTAIIRCPWRVAAPGRRANHTRASSPRWLPVPKPASEPRTLVVGAVYYRDTFILTAWSQPLATSSHTVTERVDHPENRRQLNTRAHQHHPCHPAVPGARGCGCRQVRPRPPEREQSGAGGRWSALGEVHLTGGAPPHGHPLRIARSRSRRKGTAQAFPEPVRRVRDPPPLRGSHIVLGHVVAPAGQVRALPWRDQDRVIRISTPLPLHGRLHRTRGRRSGRTRSAVTPKPDDDLAAALLAAFHFHSPTRPHAVPESTR